MPAGRTCDALDLGLNYNACLPEITGPNRATREFDRAVKGLSAPMPRLTSSPRRDVALLSSISRIDHRAVRLSCLQ